MKALSFRFNTFFQLHIVTELFQKRFSPGTAIRGIQARYLQLGSRSRPHPSNKDLGGLIVIEYGDHAHLLTV